MKSLQVDTSHRWRTPVVPTFRSAVSAFLIVWLVTPTVGIVPDHPVEDGAHYWLIFPDTSDMGVFVAVAIPLETVNKDVSVAFNVDASFNVPSNATELSMLEYEFGWRRRSTRSISNLRDVTRGIVYEGFERALGRLGFPERPCLLRAICEAAERPMGLDEHDIVSDIVHHVLTPSRSNDPDVDDEYHRAERLGTEGADCKAEFSKCAHSILSLISAD